MNFVGGIADLLALLQLLDNVRVARRRKEGWKPVQPGDNAVLDLAGRHLAGPADERRYAEAAFEDRALALRERRLPAIRPGKYLGAVVGGEAPDGVVIHAHVFQLLHHDADVVVELRHARFVDGPAILRVAQRLVFGRKVSDDVHARRIEPEEERLVVGLGLVDELQGKVADFIVHSFHPLGIERSRVFDLLLADLAPAWIHGGVVDIGRITVDHVARTDSVQQLLRIAGMRWILHRVEVIQIAEELVEAVHRRQKFVFVAKMVLAELAGGVAHSFQSSGNGYRLRGYAGGRAGLANRCHAGADRQFAGDEVGAARRAARLGVIVGEQHALGGELVEVRRPAGHHAPVVGPDIPDADVVTHDDNDVRPLPGCRRRCWLLRLRGTCQSDGRECRSGDERTTAQQQIAAFQSGAGWLRADLELFWNLIVAHDVFL